MSVSSELKRPIVSIDDISKFAKQLYGLKCKSIMQLDGYDDKNFKIEVCDYSDNKYIEKINDSGYVMKILNSLDSKNLSFVEGSNEMMLYLANLGINCSRPIKNKEGNYYSIENLSSGQHVVRLMNFLPGKAIFQVPPSARLFYQLGKFIAQLDESLKNFHHYVYDNHTTPWMLDEVVKLKKILHAIDSENQRNFIDLVLTEFEREVLPRIHSLERGMIHGDFNEQNIIVKQDKSGIWNFSSIIDFGDSNYSCYLFELAIAVTYALIIDNNLANGGYLLAGYSKIRKIPEEEFRLLKLCVMARVCQSMIIGAYSIKKDPGNHYLVSSANKGWSLLTKLNAISDNEIIDLWKGMMDFTLDE